jgi:glycosyltransferase involved in cell wall biosynthesis
MKTRATVIIPTFGNATFARWAIKSVQNQTVKDIEICIICDGSPENMISFFQNMQKEDRRIKVFSYPKSPGTGEPYRDIVIKQTTGRIICYCGHDDLWLSNHVQVMEEALKECYFTHSIHVEMNLPKHIKNENTLFDRIIWINLNRKIIKKMQGRANYFGLAFVAHTRKSYNELEEGWVTAPKDIWSDLYMWRKFLSAFGERCKTTRKVTALKFGQILRKDWTEQQRDEELRRYFEKINDPIFLTQLHKNVFNRVEWWVELLQKIKILRRFLLRFLSRRFRPI